MVVEIEDVGVLIEEVVMVEVAMLMEVVMQVIKVVES